MASSEEPPGEAPRSEPEPGKPETGEPEQRKPETGEPEGEPDAKPEPGEAVPAFESDEDAQTSIIRRHPIAPLPEPLSEDGRTSIIRREPNGDELVGPLDEPETALIRPAPRRIVGAPKPPRNTTAVAASALSIISGWATAVVATDLITGWWKTDRLFCVGVGFLTAVFAASTIGGVVGLLLRRRVGIFLTLVASALALLIFAGIFVAGAHMAGVVRAIPVLPVATTVLTLLPATWRWTR